MEEPCDDPYDKILPYGHDCIGFCRDPCPTVCRTCNQESNALFVIGDEEDRDNDIHLHSLGFWVFSLPASSVYVTTPETSVTEDPEQNVHNEVAMFLCSECGKGFSKNWILQRHTEENHSVTTVECDICAKRFKSKKSLTYNVGFLKSSFKRNQTSSKPSSGDRDPTRRGQDQARGVVVCHYNWRWRS